MGKRPTPDPKPTGFQRNAIFILTAFEILIRSVGIGTGWYWPFGVALLGLPFLCGRAYGLLLIIHFRHTYAAAGKFGVIVTSDSPVWKDYFQENWIRRFGIHFVILNKSQQSQWTCSPATRLYLFYCPQTENHCPAVILLRGLDYPLVYRFFYAFRDAKHDNVASLRTLEEGLELEMAQRSHPL